MSGCLECWDTPCVCGHSWGPYRRWSEEDRKKLIEFLEALNEEKDER